MISYLNGKIKLKDSVSVVLEVHDVGYRVFLPTSVLTKMPEIGAQVELLTYMHVREDILALYGFLTSEELEMFEQLISVSGIGPKGAMGVLSAATIEDLKAAISQGSTAILTDINGIGKKTAERIVMELKGKVAKGFTSPSTSVSNEDTEAFEALVSLGFGPSQVREVLKEVSEISGVEAKIKAGLQKINRK